MNPKILIAGPEANAGYLQPYADAVSGAGGEFGMALPTNETIKDENALKEFLRPFQGVLLPGGTDIEPLRYGESPHERPKPPDRELDESQLAIARFVLRHELPTLAICRGLQIFAVAVGFDLYNVPSPNIRGGSSHKPGQGFGLTVFYPFASAKPRLSRWRRETRLRVNPE